MPHPQPNRWLPAGVSASTWHEMLKSAEDLDHADPEFGNRVSALGSVLKRPMTTAQAAHYLEVKPEAVRKYVQRGHLAPINPGGKPLLFSSLDVELFAESKEYRRRGGGHPNSHHAQRVAAYEAAHGELPVDLP